MRKPWNGQTAWFDEIIEYPDREGNTILDIWYVFDDPAAFFGIDWADMGYSSREDYDENCFEYLIIRYNPSKDTWEPRHMIETENYIDDFPIDFDLTEEEIAEIDASIQSLKESGDLYSGKYRV